MNELQTLLKESNENIAKLQQIDQDQSSSIDKIEKLMQMLASNLESMDTLAMDSKAVEASGKKKPVKSLACDMLKKDLKESINGLRKGINSFSEELKPKEESLESFSGFTLVDDMF